MQIVQIEEKNPPITGSVSQYVGAHTTTHDLRPEDTSRNVFVVHGRNLAIRNELFIFLRALDLHPLEWSEAVRLTRQPSPYVGEILDAAFSNAHALVVLFTPDDVVRLRQELWEEHELPLETESSAQARPNVLFEAGIAMGRSQDRTVLVEIGSVKPFSDIGGVTLYGLATAQHVGRTLHKDYAMQDARSIWKGPIGIMLATSN